MSLNDIELTPGLLAGLYEKSLVGSGQKQEPAKVTDKPLPENSPGGTTGLKKEDWRFLGNNTRRILVIVQHAGLTHLPDDELKLLTGILEACGLSLEDVAIVNRDQYADKNYADFYSRFQSKYVFLFGVEPAAFGLPMQFPHFQAQRFGDSQFLHAPALGDMKDDKVLKSKLWVSLRRLFNL